MENIKIQKRLSIESLEADINKISRSKKNIDFIIPLEVEYRGFGILPTLFLVFFTWLRSNEGRLVLPIKLVNSDLDEEDSKKLFDRDYIAYILVSTAWKHRPIVDLNGRPLKEVLIKYTKRMHGQIDFLTGLPNESVLIPCFDHYSKEKGLSHWFYSTNYTFAESPTYLDTSVIRFFEILAKNYRSRLYDATKSSLEDIQKILWELLKNTHEHATKDYLNQAILNPNTRGLFMRIHRGSKENFIKFSKGVNPLNEFYSNNLNDGENYLVEISVFDSGPGLVKRFLGEKYTDNIQISEEILTIKKCLMKGQTSVKELQGLNKGFGLNDVLKLLTKMKGFFKIRTSRASVFRDLTKNPHTDLISLEQIDLYEFSDSSLNYKKWANVEGTVITLVYPICAI